MKLKYVCENCGKVAFYDDPEEAFKAGWDYPPKMYSFGMISPRTCGNCEITTTLWWAMTTRAIKSIADMTPQQKETFDRIMGEPQSIMVTDDEN